MIACDNEECKIQWSHACKLLEDVPDCERTLECSDCHKTRKSRGRVKYKMIND